MTSSPTPDQAAAHEFLTELRTRIVTQPLPYQQGVEESALESFWKLFEFAREAIKKHPGCDHFAERVTEVLNTKVRPLTGKWHRAKEEGRLKSRDGADEFRGELLAVQKNVSDFAIELKCLIQGIKYVNCDHEDETEADKGDDLFAPLAFGVANTGAPPGSEASCVNEAEALEISERRRRGKPSPETSLSDVVGLALSGGGIRSATFSLGVVQVLADKGLLKDIDLLSTVSGGGYTGSFITSHVGRGEPLSELASPRGPDTRTIARLRQNAKFLAARNLKESWSMVISTVAGMVLNWSVPLLIVVLLALLAVWVDPYLTTQRWLYVVGGASLLTAFTFISYNLHLRSTRPKLVRFGSVALAGATAIAFLLAAAWLIHAGYHFLPDLRGSRWLVSGSLGALIAAGPAIVRFLPVLKNPKVRKTVLKILLLAAGLIVPLAALATFYLFVFIGKLPGKSGPPANSVDTASRVFISYAKEDFEAANRLRGELEAAGIQAWFDRNLTNLPPGNNWKLEIDDQIDHQCSVFLSLISRTSETVVDRTFHYERNLAAERARKFPNGGGFYFPVVVDPGISPASQGFVHEPRGVRHLQAITCPEGQVPPEFVKLLSDAQGKRRLTLQVAETAGTIDGKLALVGIAVCLLALVVLPLDINRTAPHRLYRNGLARTFVQAWNGEKDQPLPGINPNGGAPYHLINAAVNLPTSSHPAVKDRRCDFFLFSKHWTGSTATGYLKSDRWKSGGKTVDLATAMAVSGAAFSSYMGLGSMPSLTALLTVLNIRLGYWIKHPDRTSGVGPSPGFICLLREMTGIGMSEKKPWLNLSDGGHIENLAVYELLRRRCKFIVCVDGEADPAFTFEGFMTLVRHARIDFGVTIEPDLDQIRPDPVTGLSKCHYHFCRIHYPALGDKPAGTGLLLYLKLSVTGNESELVKRYRINHPEFPHQTTLDQFFDQEQFEAYRQLGVHVASGLFGTAVTSRNASPACVEDWFRSLATNLLEPCRNYQRIPDPQNHSAP